MKKSLFGIAILLATGLTFAAPNAEDSKLSECCTVTVSNNSTGDSATVTRCATHFNDACNLAYKKALRAVK